MFAAAAANCDSSEADVSALEVECDAGAAGGCEDAPPVWVSSGESGFYQRGIRDGARDFVSGAVGWRAANFDFDHSLRAFAVGDDCECERAANTFQGRAESLVVCVLFCDFW